MLCGRVQIAHKLHRFAVCEGTVANINHFIGRVHAGQRVASATDRSQNPFLRIAAQIAPLLELQIVLVLPAGNIDDLIRMSGYNFVRFA